MQNENIIHIEISIFIFVFTTFLYFQRVVLEFLSTNYKQYFLIKNRKIINYFFTMLNKA